MRIKNKNSITINYETTIIGFFIRLGFYNNLSLYSIYEKYRDILSEALQIIDEVSIVGQKF